VNGGLNLVTKHRSAIMGFAALWIFINHEWQYLLAGVPQLAFAEQFIKRIGFCGVDIFLFLSGIGLVFAMNKGSVWRFYGRRFSRVFPPFLIMGVIFLFMRDWSLEVFLKNISGYHFFTKSIYSMLWFVPAVSVFYLVFPLYHGALRRVPNQTHFTLAVLAVWVLFSLHAAQWMRNDLFGFTNRIPIFAAGVLAGWYIREKKGSFTWISWVMWLAVLTVGLMLAYKTNFEGFYLLVPVSNCCIPNFLIAISGSCLLAGLMELLDRYCWIPGKVILKFFGFFGAISLEFYCVQETVGRELRNAIWGKYPVWFINLADFACSLAAALALYGVCWGIRFLYGKLFSVLFPGKQTAKQ